VAYKVAPEDMKRMKFAPPNLAGLAAMLRASPRYRVHPRICFRNQPVLESSKPHELA
jgi:hypothetical protein